MFNYTEQAEKKYLKNIINLISERIREITSKISNKDKEILAEKRNLWQNIYELDPMEIVSTQQNIENEVSLGNADVEYLSTLKRMKKSPFFGRIAFEYDDGEVSNFYIGMHNFSKDNSSDILVTDWRAPVSSMFYDFELGEASYQAPMGTICGKILLKRQYKIADGKMQYMFESSLNINDEILQQVLSQNSNEKMGNIVTTIQKEQNKIIRNDESDILIIQGVVGSGKTSIALHRIAYLLYKHKDRINSRNILIISPNKIFSDYISNVLPELGENRILEVCMDDIAHNELGEKIVFESKYKQDEKIIFGKDKSYAERVKFKSTDFFVGKLKDFALEYYETCFNPEAIIIGEYEISKEFILGRFKNYSNISIYQRIERTLDDIYCKIESDGIKADRKTKDAIKKFVLQKLNYTNVLSLYESFYNWLEKPEMFVYNGKVIEYSDVFPIIFLKRFVEGGMEFGSIKHLVVDEMQDYTQMQYEVLKMIFNCKKTILGDESQMLNPYSNNAESIKKVFPEAEILKLEKSYRSTYEIIKFVQDIVESKRLIPIERHGEKPEIIKCDNINQKIEQIVNDFKKSTFNSLCVIGKTLDEAKRIYSYLSSRCNNVTLMDYDSSKFSTGIIITTAYIAKGLEFDSVVIADCNSNNYNTAGDKGLLYIACTRAMHKLTLLYDNELSEFVK